MPGWLIDRPENEATPPTALTVFFPASVPAPGLVVMAMLMAAFEFVTVAPNWSTTWTLTGPALGESKLEEMLVLIVVPAGCPSAVNTSEHGLELVQPP